MLANRISKILIRVDSTKKVALGHLKRCVSLAAMLDEMDVKTIFLTAKDEYSKELISEYGFDHKFIVHLTNSNEDNSEVLRYAKELKADAVIIDSYEIDNKYRKNLMDSGLFLASISDIGYMDLVSDMIINSNLNAEKLPYSVDSHTSLFLGIEYLILGKEFWSNHDISKNKNDVKNILITMGGIDHHNLTTRIIRLLDGFNDEFTITVIVGPYYENKESIITAKKTSKKHVDIIDSAKTIYKYMKNSNLAFSAGGQTLYELSVLGIPTIGILLWKNQAGNIKELTRMNAIKSLSYSEDDKFNKDLNKITKDLLSDASKRFKLSKIASSIVDGQGAKRSAEAIVQQYKLWRSRKYSKIN